MSFLLSSVIVVLLFSIRFEGWKDFNKDYLSVDSTRSLRGFLAIMAVLQHISERVTDSGFFSILFHVGYMIVALFFFLSGYGLMTQYVKKGRKYFDGFFKNRILYLMIIYLTVTIIFAFFNMAMGEDVSINSILISFINGHPTARHSWYILVQLLFYFVFWIAYIINPHVEIMFVSTLLGVTFVTVLLFVLGYSPIWCMSNFAFVLGVFWAIKKDNIFYFVSNHYVLSILVSLSLFILSSMLPNIVGRIYLTYQVDNILYTLFRVISSCAITVVCLLIMLKISFVSKIWNFLGKISLEIYLLHALAYSFLRSSYIYVENNVVWTIGTLVISIFIAYIGNICSSKFHNFLHSL